MTHAGVKSTGLMVGTSRVSTMFIVQAVNSVDIATTNGHCFSFVIHTRFRLVLVFADPELYRKHSGVRAVTCTLKVSLSSKNGQLAATTKLLVGIYWIVS